MTDNAATENDKNVKQLKRRLECWREIVLPINSLLLWEKSWHPSLILSITTSTYLFFWFCEPAFLTIIAISLLTLALADYLVPIIASTFVSSSAWNGQKERKLDEICQRLSVMSLRLQNAWTFLLHARSNRPNIYYGSITLCLLVLAWLGNTVNNLVLIYIVGTFILFAPGLRHKGRAEAAIKYAYHYMMHRKMAS